MCIRDRYIQRARVRGPAQTPRDRHPDGAGRGDGNGPAHDRLPGHAHGPRGRRARALGRVLSSLLYGVRTSDPATYAAVATLLCVVALAASVLPAMRAARID